MMMFLDDDGTTSAIIAGAGIILIVLIILIGGLLSCFAKSLKQKNKDEFELERNRIKKEIE